MRRTAADIPDRWCFLPIKEGNVRVASFYGLMESTTENAPLSAPMTLDSWLSAAEGDASGFWFQSLLADLAFPEAFVWGEYAAAARLDAQAARDYFSSGGQERDSNLGDAATAFGWGGGRLADAWPAAPDEGEYSRVRTSKVETLLIGGALDFATPPQVATKELLPHLPNGHQVVLAGFGHSTDFWTYQPEAGSRLINTFFDSGRVDDSLYEPQTRRLHARGHADGARQGHRGRDGRPRAPHGRSRCSGWLAGCASGDASDARPSATLRSLYPIVLGLGGWFLGVLIVITTMPGVPLDDELLAALSRRRADRARDLLGLGAPRLVRPGPRPPGSRRQSAGALVGAWLGFHATADLLALVTAIVGAVAGANLILSLDIAWARQARDHAVETSAKETLEARPSTG